MVSTRRNPRKTAVSTAVDEFGSSDGFGSGDQPVAEDELVAEEPVLEQLDEDDSDEEDDEQGEDAVYSVEDVTVGDVEGCYIGSEPAIAEPGLDLPEVPSFTDAVEGMNYCNYLLSELMMKLMNSSPNSRLKRSVCSLMGEAVGNQWLAQVAHLSGHRQGFCNEIVEQTMKGSLGIR